MTWFDLIVLAILALSTGFAVIRGGVKEVGTLAALAIAGGLAWILCKPVTGLLGLSNSFLGSVATLAALLSLSFVAVYLVLHFLLERFRFSGRALTADRIGGGVFGFARGLVLLGLGFLAYGYYLEEARWPDPVRNAATLPVARSMASLFEGFAPEEPELNATEDQPAEPETNAAVEGYGRADRTALAEIMTTVTTTDGSGNEDGEAADDADPIATLLARDDQE